MASRRPESDPTRADSVPALRHNPFAALRADGVRAESKLESAPKAAPDAAPSSARAAVVVRREKKGRGGKAVTLAAGPGLAGRDLDALARELAKALGAGARVEDGALVVQGEQVERVVAWLGQRGFADIVRGN